MKCMEKVARIFHSHTEADVADALWDAQLSPEERIRMADAAQQGLERVCRVAKLERS